MDYLSSKAIKVIEERDVPGQLLLDLGIAPVDVAMAAGLDAIQAAMSKPAIETIEEQDIAAIEAMNKALREPAIEEPKKTSKSYSWPTVYDVDDRGEIQVVDRELGGYVALEDYDRLLVAYEEQLARLDWIRTMAIVEE